MYWEFNYIAMGVVLLLTSFIQASLWVVFEKAGQPGWYALVPVLQVAILLKITGYDWWWALVPLASLVFYIMALNRLARSFGYDVWMTLGFLFLPFGFFPYVAMSSDVYMRESEWL